MPAMLESAQVGKVQDLADKIYNVNAEETPFISTIGENPQPNQMLGSWQGEVYPDVPSTGILDNTAASTPASVGRELMQGVCQIFRREWGVGLVADHINIAGLGRNEKARQLAIAMILHRKMLEQQFLSADDAVAESGMTPWQCRGALEWLKDSAQAAYPVPATLRPATAALYTGAFASLTQDTFRICLMAAAAQRKTTLKLTGFVGDQLKAAIDDWTNIYPVASTSSQPRMTYVVQNNDVVKNVVDQLRFSAGSIDLLISWLINRTTSTGAETTYARKSGIFVDPKMWKKAFLMKPKNTNAAADGSGTRGWIDAIARLEPLNLLGQFKVQPSS
jgi:hypothetical protein